MERVSRLKCVVRRVGVDAGQFLGVVDRPFRVGCGRFLAVVRQATPLEQAPANDLGHLRAGRHHDGLAASVKQLLERLVVALVIRVHLQLGCGNRHA